MNIIGQEYGTKRATNKKEEHMMYHHAASKIYNYKYMEKKKKVPGIVCS